MMYLSIKILILQQFLIKADKYLFMYKLGVVYKYQECKNKSFFNEKHLFISDVLLNTHTHTHTHTHTPPTVPPALSNVFCKSAKVRNSSDK